MTSLAGTRAACLLGFLVLAFGCQRDNVASVPRTDDGDAGTADGGASHDAGQLTLEGLPLPPAKVGIPYSATIVARGGVGPLAWSFRGALPEGLTLSPPSGPNVVVNGTPVRSGQVRFELGVQDERGLQAAASIDLRVRGRRWVVYDTGTFVEPAIQLVDLTQAEASPADHFDVARWVGLQPGGAKGAIVVGGEAGGLFVIDFGGLARSAPVRFAPANANPVGWSPDGRQFAYLLGPTAFVVAPGSAPVPVANIPDGESLEWIRWVGSSLVYGLKSPEAINGSTVRVELVPARPLGAPRVLENRPMYSPWPSPHGHRLAYTVPVNPAAPETTAYDLFVVGVDGHPPQSPVKLNREDPRSLGVSAFEWTADGTRLVYTSVANDTGGRSLWVARFEGGKWLGSHHLDGGQPTAAGDWRNIGFFALSPDSASVVYTAADKILGGRIAELWHVGLGPDQGPPRNVSGPAGPAPEPLGGRHVDNVDWSGDSRWLAFTRRADVGETEASSAFLVDMSGPEPGPPVRIDGATIPGPATPGSFSPDSTRFLLRWATGPAVTPRGPPKEDLFLIDVLHAGQAPPIRINDPLPEGTDLEPRGYNIGKWSADGSQILFLTKDAAGTSMFLADLSAGTPSVRRLSPPGKNAGLWYEGNFIEP